MVQTHGFVGQGSGRHTSDRVSLRFDQRISVSLQQARARAILQHIVVPGVPSAMSDGWSLAEKGLLVAVLRSRVCACAGGCAGAGFGCWYRSAAPLCVRACVGGCGVCGCALCLVCLAFLGARRVRFASVRASAHDCVCVCVRAPPFQGSDTVGERRAHSSHSSLGWAKGARPSPAPTRAWTSARRSSP